MRGYDAGKKVTGRKRHLLVDTLGLILTAVVHPADVQDRVGAKLVLEKLQWPWTTIRKVWADGGYSGQPLADWVKALRPRRPCNLEIVPKPAKGFAVLPRRWVVERTFGWLGKFRRLAKDYETSTASSEAFIYIAQARQLLASLAKSSLQPTF